MLSLMMDDVAWCCDRLNGPVVPPHHVKITTARTLVLTTPLSPSLLPPSFLLPSSFLAPSPFPPKKQKYLKNNSQKQEGWIKPKPDSPADHKRRYIQAKYVWKGFVEGSSDREDEEVDAGIGDAAGGSVGGGAHGRRSSRDGSNAGGDVSGGGGSGGASGTRGVGADRWSLRLSECAGTGDLPGAVEALAHGD